MRTDHAAQQGRQAFGQNCILAPALSAPCSAFEDSLLERIRIFPKQFCSFICEWLGTPDHVSRIRGRCRERILEDVADTCAQLREVVIVFEVACNFTICGSDHVAAALITIICQSSKKKDAS